jgi:hypothetical protein
MGVRRQTAEHPFGTTKCWMGATHFLTKELPKVATETVLSVLAYNMKRVMAAQADCWRQCWREADLGAAKSSPT